MDIGCKKCGIEKNADNKRSNNDEFIKKAFDIHNNKYDYSKVEYKNALEKVIIICKEHGDFEQKPSCHLSEHGCPKCNGGIKYTTYDFIEKAIKIHNNKYDYSKVEYKNCNEKVIIICKEHGNFQQIPSDHLNGHGCIKCGGRFIFNTYDFINKAIEIHRDKYNYSNINYIMYSLKVNIICNEHGEFEQIASSHLIGQGCPKCGIIKRSETHKYDTNIFIEKANKIHNNKYDYSKVDYIKHDLKVNIICKIHGEFEQIASSHLIGQCCPKCCKSKQYSKSQISWLNFISKYNNINIQHAENIGEFTIPTTKYKADGYCKETNTIYEYNGDYYHGNPKLFKSIEFNKTTNCTFGDLYQKTLEREQQIKDLGYNLVVMWEYDWNIINKSIRKIQQKFRNSKLLV